MGFLVTYTGEAGPEDFVSAKTLELDFNLPGIEATVLFVVKSQRGVQLCLCVFANIHIDYFVTKVEDYLVVKTSEGLIGDVVAHIGDIYVDAIFPQSCSKVSTALVDDWVVQPGI